MPIHTHISTPTGASIALWHLTETEAALASLLGDEAYRQLSSQGLSPKRFCEQAATRLLLDRLDETRGGVMAHTTEGQPYLTDRPGHLSISHTRQWVAIAWHPTRPVGIDIERLGARVERVADRVFNENELQAHTDSPRSHTLWLHLCWSAKEALFKAMPEAGIDFRTQLHVAPPRTLAHEGLFTAVENRTSAHGRYTLWYATHDEWVMVCATPLP
ncbi:4'-phosphopantetheinyl transferase family protein [Barnesiella viscericola]|uniref:4'-phosphopantetheinyl transferase family protein n=1 Tax=Barnesiella viscericola TaxID=397865 RepID=UPI00235719C0|nr:4'-phosphopantetheinyl transferase superfamily protein [Barnesiella viscericola]